MVSYKALSFQDIELAVIDTRANLQQLWQDSGVSSNCAIGVMFIHTQVRQALGFFGQISEEEQEAFKVYFENLSPRVLTVADVVGDGQYLMGLFLFLDQTGQPQEGTYILAMSVGGRDEDVVTQSRLMTTSRLLRAAQQELLKVITLRPEAW